MFILYFFNNTILSNFNSFIIKICHITKIVGEPKMLKTKKTDFTFIIPLVISILYIIIKIIDDINHFIIWGTNTYYDTNSDKNTFLFASTAETIILLAMIIFATVFKKNFPKLSYALVMYIPLFILSCILITFIK